MLDHEPSTWDSVALLCGNEPFRMRQNEITARVYAPVRVQSSLNWGKCVTPNLSLDWSPRSGLRACYTTRSLFQFRRTSNKIVRAYPIRKLPSQPWSAPNLAQIGLNWPIRVAQWVRHVGYRRGVWYWGIPLIYARHKSPMCGFT